MRLAKGDLVRRPLLAAALVAAGVLAATATPATSAAFASPAPLKYVALGDSYSAASGTLPPDPSASPLCLRATDNYPHLLASATGASLTDVTCGGAETSDYFSSQYPGVSPQLNALSKSTNLVTMTIGGNDSSVFIDSIAECGALGVASLGQGSPCKDKYGKSFDNTINNTTYPALVKTLRAVRTAAPNAKVAILGYLTILPASGGCFPQMPVATGDVPYLDNLQATLNSAVQRAAAATGVTYVNMTGVSQSHNACQPIGTRWVEPVIGGTNPVIVHPNALGEEAMAQQVMKALKLKGTLPTPLPPVG
jgi:lysophospholipase L1-like esterase